GPDERLYAALAGGREVGAPHRGLSIFALPVVSDLRFQPIGLRIASPAAGGDVELLKRSAASDGFHSFRLLFLSLHWFGWLGCAASKNGQPQHCHQELLHIRLPVMSMKFCNRDWRALFYEIHWGHSLWILVSNSYELQSPPQPTE